MDLFKPYLILVRYIYIEVLFYPFFPYHSILDISIPLQKRNPGSTTPGKKRDQKIQKSNEYYNHLGIVI